MKQENAILLSLDGGEQENYRKQEKSVEQVEPFIGEKGRLRYPLYHPASSQHIIRQYFCHLQHNSTTSHIRKRCNTCSYTTSLTSIQGPPTFQVRQKFTCKSSSLAHCIECKFCTLFNDGITCQNSSCRYIASSEGKYYKNTETQYNPVHSRTYRMGCTKTSTLEHGLLKSLGQCLSRI